MPVRKQVGPPRMPLPLTAMQATYVHARVVRGLAPTQAAEAAGYSSAKVNAWQLEHNPTIHAAIRFETIRIIENNANVALRCLASVMEDTDAPASARVSAAKTWLQASNLLDRRGGRSRTRARISRS
ncbi:phage terminase small subunit [uncultured Gammaproteobacteria bacterium]